MHLGLVIPEPNDALLAFGQELSGHGDVSAFAPWHIPDVSGRPVAALARRVGLGPFVARRRRSIPHADRLAGFTIVDLAARTYARRGAAQGFQARFALRGLVDYLASRWLRGLDRPLTHLFAPSMAARALFAHSRGRATRLILLEDVPDLQGLAADLDRAAIRWPACGFLQNHRPPHWATTRQAAERCLADAVGVRGRFAWKRLARSSEPRLFGWGLSGGAEPNAGTGAISQSSDTWRVLVAGPALGRSGTALLGEVADALPWVRLLVQPADVTEPPGLLDHPQITAVQASTTERIRKANIDAVMAVAVVESHPSEVRAAVELGIPVIGTAHALGQVEGATTVECTAEALAEALTKARSSGGSKNATGLWCPPQTVADIL